MSLARRLERLEERAADPGRLVVWWKCDGEPEPEHGQNDVVLVVVRDGDEQAANTN